MDEEMNEAKYVSLMAELGKIPEEAKPRAVSGGVLAGVHLGPRTVAKYARAAGFTGDYLFEAVAICGSESWLFTRAHNDNLELLTDLHAGQVVCNQETYEKTTVVDPVTGKVKLSNGQTVTVPLTTLWITTRDVGLWEINIPASGIGTKTEEDLYDPKTNATRAFAMFTNRGWQPWVGYTSNAYLHDTYIQWSMLGCANRWGEIAHAAAAGAGIVQQTKVPWISIPQLRKIYPTIPLG